MRVLQTRSVVSVAVWLLVSLAVPASAQSQGERQTVTITEAAPVFAAANETQAPVRTARAGSILLLIGTNAEWTRVEFQDPQFGRRLGFVQTKFLRFNKRASAAAPVTVGPPQAPSSSQQPTRSAKAETVAGYVEWQRDGYLVADGQ